MGLVFLSPGWALASVAEFQVAASAHPDLMHQYTFDGNDEAARRADKKGRADLSLQLVGTGVATDLEYEMPGFDPSSESVKTTRGPGTDNANGAYLRAPAITLGESVSFECLFQPSQAEISGGSFNLAYIICTRVDSDRGYFLTQGGPLPSRGMRLASTMGNLHSAPNTNVLLDAVTPGNWYYAAGSYRVDGGRVTFTNYLADLTAGQTTLTEIGPFTNDGGTYPLVSTPLGIGGRWDSQESFPGFIDEINLYNAELSGDVFQEHLNLITGAGALAFRVAASGQDLAFAWESKAGKRYNLRSAVTLETDPATWELAGGLGHIEATPPENTLTIARPPDPERFYVIEEFNPPPVVVFSDDFESGQGGWTIGFGDDGSPGTAWELGPPSGVGPASARSPANCFGTNISANYADDAEVWLLSPPIDLTTAGVATLSYYEFREIEEGFDGGRLAIVDAADGSMLAVIEGGIDGFTADWQMVRKTVPAEALGKTIKIEFSLASDAFGNFAGWYIDDVEVTVP